VRVEPGWDAVLKQRQINWILVPVGSPLSNILKAAGEWKINYEDTVAVLFSRAERNSTGK
jgi:hypothetical protein